MPGSDGEDALVSGSVVVALEALPKNELVTLLPEDAVTMRSDKAATVASGSQRYRVSLDSEDGDRCNCTWFAKHGTSRGSCKHILAVRMIAEKDDE